MKPIRKNVEEKLKAVFLSSGVFLLIGVAFSLPVSLLAVPVTDDTGDTLTFSSDIDTNGDDVTLTDTGNNGDDTKFVTFSGNIITNDGLFTFTRRGDLTISGNLITKNFGNVSITDPIGVTIVTPSVTTLSGDVNTEGGTSLSTEQVN